MNSLESLKSRISQMSVQEMQHLLLHYMQMEQSADPRCSIKVVRNTSADGRGVRGFYDILLVDEKGMEHVINFQNRPAKVIFLLLLINKGFQRRKLQQDNYACILNLYNLLFSCPLVKVADTLQNHFNRYVSQAISTSRKAVESALEGIDNPEAYRIADPKSHNGMLFIPLAKEYSERIILEPNLISD